MHGAWASAGPTLFVERSQPVHPCQLVPSHRRSRQQLGLTLRWRLRLLLQQLRLFRCVHLFFLLGFTPRRRPGLALARASGFLVRGSSGGGGARACASRVPGRLGGWGGFGGPVDCGCSLFGLLFRFGVGFFPLLLGPGDLRSTHHLSSSLKQRAQGLRTYVVGDDLAVDATRFKQVVELCQLLLGFPPFLARQAFQGDVLKGRIHVHSGRFRDSARPRFGIFVDVHLGRL